MTELAPRFLVSDADRVAIGSESLDILSTCYANFFNTSGIFIELSLVSLSEMKEINTIHRSIPEPTDVLSFPLFESLESIQASTEAEKLIGSIVISPEKASIYEESLPQLVHHGLLHLAGFDHETDLTAWKTAELPLIKLLESTGLPIPTIPYESL